MAQINREDDSARYDVDLIRLDAESSHGRDGGCAERTCDRFDGLNHGGSTGERVAPSRHRCRSRMIGAAGHRHFEMRGADNGADDRQRHAR